MKEILFLSPIFKYRIWGKDKLKTYYPMIPTIKITEPKIDPAYAAAQLALIQSHK